DGEACDTIYIHQVAKQVAWWDADDAVAGVLVPVNPAQPLSFDAIIRLASDGSAHPDPYVNVLDDLPTVTEDTDYDYRGHRRTVRRHLRGSIITPLSLCPRGGGQAWNGIPWLKHASVRTVA